MDCWLGLPVQNSDRSSRRHISVGVFPVGYSAASSSPRDWRSDRRPSKSAMPRRKKRSGPPRPVGRNAIGRPQGLITGLPSNMTWKASKWVKPGTGTELWTTPPRTRMAVPLALEVCLCVDRYNWQAGRLDQGEKCLT